MRKTYVILWMWTLVLGMAFLFSSCGHTNMGLVKKMEGSWILEEEPVEEEESVTLYTTEMQFSKFEKGEKLEDGFYGPYKEIRRIQYTDYEGDNILSYTLSGTITGQWKIEKEYLYLTYLVSGIEVTMDDFDIEWKDGSSLSQSELDKLREEFEESLCSNFYQRLSEEYQSDDEYVEVLGATMRKFHNVKIKNDEMTFVNEYDMPLVIHRKKK